MSHCVQQLNRKVCKSEAVRLWPKLEISEAFSKNWINYELYFAEQAMDPWRTHSDTILNITPYNALVFNRSSISNVPEDPVKSLEKTMSSNFGDPGAGCG